MVSIRGRVSTSHLCRFFSTFGPGLKQKRHKFEQNFFSLRQMQTYWLTCFRSNERKYQLCGAHKYTHSSLKKLDSCPDEASTKGLWLGLKVEKIAARCAALLQELQ